MARKQVGNRAEPSAPKTRGAKSSAAKSVNGRALSRTEPAGPPGGYGELLEELKTRVRGAQLKAAVAANRELIQLYWDIGRLIVERQEREKWGTGVIQTLADDVQRAFPEMRGFSRTNVFRMRSFFLAHSPAVSVVPQAVGQLEGKKGARSTLRSTQAKVPQPVGRFTGPVLSEPFADIPWGHNIILVEKVKEPDARHWYAFKTLENGWSRAVLTVQIESDLYRRQGKAVTNFTSTLPAPQSDLAQQTLKDPYVFDFLTIAEDAQERELETGLIDHIQKFLLELGAGFSFVGRQFPLTVGNDDFSIDLLFYHLRLRCFVVIDLKMRQFTPEDAGKLNFYLSAIDSQMRHRDDQPSIGLVLCKTRNRVIAEYALRDISKPIGVAEWHTQLVQSLPEPLRSNLPTIEQIEGELGGPR